MGLLLINPQICERLQKNSGDLPINAIGTSEEVFAQSHDDVRGPILWSWHSLARPNMFFYLGNIGPNNCSFFSQYFLYSFVSLELS